MAENTRASIIKQTSKRKHHQLKLEMTPMVDLAFLLLTFFVLAASLIKPKTLEIIYPTDGEGTDVNEKIVTTLLLGDKSVECAYYRGIFGSDTTQLIMTHFSANGFRRFLSELNRTNIKAIYDLEEQQMAGLITDEDFTVQYRNVVAQERAPVIVVKTMKGTKYVHVIAAIDELNIADERKRVIQNMSESEILLLKEVFQWFFGLAKNKDSVTRFNHI